MFGNAGRAQKRARPAALAPFLFFMSTLDASAQAAPTDDSRIVWIILSVFTLACAAWAGWMFYTARKFGALAAASKTWPTVSGKVIESRVDAIHHAKSGYSYRPVVRYEYDVAGTRYEGNMIEFGLMDLPLEKNALDMIKKRPAGAAVAVHYQPAEPKTATLDTGSKMASGRKVGGWIVIVVWVAIVGTLLYFTNQFGTR